MSSRASVDRLTTGVRFGLRDPRLLLDYVALTIRGRLGRLEPEGRPPIEAALSTDEARERISRTVGAWSEGESLALVRASVPASYGDGDGAATARSMAGDPSLGVLAYALVRALRPTAVVETGVATGVTSAHVLAALADNGMGELHSVDLPPRPMLSSDLVGCAVPAELKDRWHYHLGSSRRLLPRVLQRTGPGGPRVFIHDSDHSYGNMRWEVERAWEALEPGDWLLADDIQWSTAFDDFAAAVGGDPIVVAQEEPGCFTGMLRRA